MFDLRLWVGRSDRQLLLLLLERQNTTMADITDLKASVANLTNIMANVGPVLQANTDLGIQIVGTVERILALVGQTGPSQAEIDALSASVTAALAQLNDDISSVNATNAALQAEIAKAAPSPTPAA